MWTIVFLAMGGIALGKGVMSSGLLEVMDELIRDLVDGFSLYSVVLVLSPVVLVSISAPSGIVLFHEAVFHGCIHDANIYLPFLPRLCCFSMKIISTFISHTIASVLLVPIAKEVGQSLPGNHANLLIFITGLICSTGMGMPVSGFPNQTA